MSISYSLIPSPSDISVGLLSSLLGAGWESLATGTSGPAGTGIIIAQLLAILNVALLGFISALVMYQTTLGAMMTAHEGTPLGKKYHSIFAPIRGPLAFLMATPLPMAKGLSLLQVTLLFCIHMSIGIADSVWSTFVAAAPAQSYTASQGTDDAANVKFVHSVIYNAVVREFLIKENGATFNEAQWVFKDDSVLGNSSGTYTLREIPTDQSVGKNLGAISYRCSKDTAEVPTSPEGFMHAMMSGAGNAIMSTGHALSNITGFGSPQNSPACVGEQKAINAVRSGAISIADQIIAQGTAADTTSTSSGSSTTSTQAAPIISDQIAALIQNYEIAQKSNAVAVTQQTGTVLQQQEADFAATASKLGWASSIFYYWKISEIEQAAGSQMATLYPDVSPPDMVNVNNSTVGMETYMTVASNLIGLVDQRALEGANATHGFDGVSNDNIDGLSMIANKALQAMVTGNPVINFATWGNEAINVGEGTLAAAAALSVVAKGTSEAGDAVKSTGTPASKVAGAVTSMAGWAVGKGAAVAYGVAVILIVQGFIGAFIIPSMPSFVMLAAVAGWVVLVLELLVAAPLWAAAHAYADGDGVTSQESKTGYAVAIGVIFRPVLLTFGFIFSFMLITVFGNFAGLTLSMFFQTLVSGQTIGPVTVIGVITLSLAAFMMILKYLLGIGPHLANNAPRWIGGQGASLGEEGRAEGGASDATRKSSAMISDSGKQIVTGIGAGKVSERDAQLKTPTPPTRKESPADDKGATVAKDENDKPVAKKGD